MFKLRGVKIKDNMQTALNKNPNFRKAGGIFSLNFNLIRPNMENEKTKKSKRVGPAVPNSGNLISWPAKIESIKRKEVIIYEIIL